MTDKIKTIKSYCHPSVYIFLKKNTKKEEDICDICSIFIGNGKEIYKDHMVNYHQENHCEKCDKYFIYINYHMKNFHKN